MIIIIILCKWFICSVWPIDGILTGTITPDLSGPGSNGNKKVFYTPQNSRTGASQSDAV